MRVGAGRFKGRRLPEARGARPIAGRLRTSLFDHLGACVDDARVLDLCAGVGALGLEALSRGARHVTLVEQDPEQVRALERWSIAAGVRDQVLTLRRDVRRPLPPGPFELVFVDPPFSFWADSVGPELLRRAVECAVPGGRVVVKAPAARPLEPPPGTALVRRNQAGASAYSVFQRAV